MSHERLQAMPIVLYSSEISLLKKTPVGWKTSLDSNDLGKSSIDVNKIFRYETGVVDSVADLIEGDESSDSEDDLLIDYWTKNHQVLRSNSDNESSNELGDENTIDASEASLEADESEPEAVTFRDSSIFVGMIEKRALLRLHTRICW